MSEQLAFVVDPEEEAVAAPPAVAEPEEEAVDEQLPAARRCGGRFEWHGRPLRCEQPSRHSGWHTSQPRRGALVRWNDAGSYEARCPSDSRPRD